MAVFARSPVMDDSLSYRVGSGRVGSGRRWLPLQVVGRVMAAVWSAVYRQLCPSSGLSSH